MKPKTKTVKTVELPCSGCGAKVQFATPETTKNPTFFHPIPYCARFDGVNTTDELLVYMRECKAKLDTN